MRITIDRALHGALRRHSIAFALLTFGGTAACSPDRDFGYGRFQAGPGYEIVLAPETYVLPETVVVAAQVFENEIIAPQSIGQVQIGDVLLSSVDQGFIRKVVAIELVGGQTKIKTAPAMLTEAIEEAEIDLVMAFEKPAPGSFGPASPINPQVRTKLIPTDTVTTCDGLIEWGAAAVSRFGGECALYGEENILSFDVPLNATLFERSVYGVPVRLGTEGHFHFSPLVRFRLVIHSRTVEEIMVAAGNRVDTSLLATLSSGGSIAHNGSVSIKELLSKYTDPATRTLLEQLTSVDVPVGPIVINLGIDLQAWYEFSLQGEFLLSGGATYQKTQVLGAAYKNIESPAWKPINWTGINETEGPGFEFIPPTVNFSAGASGKIGIDLVPQLGLYGVQLGEFAVGPYVFVPVTPFETPPYRLDVGIRGGGSVGIHEIDLKFCSIEVGLVYEFDAFDTIVKSYSPTSQDYDKSPPNTYINGGPFGTVNFHGASFVFSGADNVAVEKFECRWDNGAWQTCVSGEKRTGLSDGLHIFEVVAIDTSGNRDPSPAKQTWYIDTSEPDRTLPDTWIASSAPAKINDGGGSAAVNVATASFTYACNKGACNFECSLNGATFGACSTSGISYSGLQEKIHVFEVRAIDVSSNKDNKPAEIKWRVDVTQPDTTLDISGPSGTTTNKNASFSFSGNDGNGSGIEKMECKLSGPSQSHDWKLCDSLTSHSYSNLALGDYEFWVRAVEKAGNVDQSPPKRSWTIESSGGGGISTETITLNSIDCGEVWQSNPNATHGISSSFWTGAEWNGNYVYSYLKFENSGWNSIPANATIDLAELVIYEQVDGAESVAIRLAGGPWSSATLTWNNQPTIVGPSVLLTSNGSSSIWQTFDVTNAVRQWADGTYSKNGFAIYSSVTPANTVYSFHGQGTNVSLRPRLDITYSY